MGKEFLFREVSYGIEIIYSNDYDKYDELLEEGFPEKFREALQISHKLSNQISHISDAISKEIDKADDIRYLSSLTKLGIKATKLNLEVIM